MLPLYTHNTIWNTVIYGYWYDFYWRKKTIIILTISRLLLSDWEDKNVIKLNSLFSFPIIGYINNQNIWQIKNRQEYILRTFENP